MATVNPELRRRFSKGEITCVNFVRDGQESHASGKLNWGRSKSAEVCDYVVVDQTAGRGKAWIHVDEIIAYEQMSRERSKRYWDAKNRATAKQVDYYLDLIDRLPPNEQGDYPRTELETMDRDAMSMLIAELKGEL